ncbi:MAG: hypothetical protein JO000_05265 [Alphaproteobacteria bacterium]|nr:hypothetical protein [Alphaproteobacteria bacterium]
MRSRAILFTAIGLSAILLALPALAQPAARRDQAPQTRSDDDADFDSADAPDDGNAPMGARRPRPAHPVQNRPAYRDRGWYFNHCPSYCISDGRPIHQQGSLCPAECTQ